LNAVMRNQAMARKLKAGKAIDISSRPRTKRGDYVLAGFTDDVDYCDATQEAWVWSIGKLLEPVETTMMNGDVVILPAGTILASLDSNHYSAGQSQIIECVWLR
jgi:hypothetical protein